MKALLILTIAAAPLLAQHHHHDESLNWDYHDQENIQRSFNLGVSGRKLAIDNVSGYIHVTATDGSQVQINVVRHNYGDSRDRLDYAKRRVKLDISQDGNFVDVYEDGPFRNGHGDCCNDRDGYLVVFDYDVQVPRDTELELKNFNHGDIAVTGTSGKFNVHDFNGGITMDQVAGSGRINTFNGPVKATFSRPPEGDLDVKSFNGPVDMYFPKDLNADLKFKTFHGGVYTDFEVTARAETADGRLDRARWVYRSGDSGSARIGTGGPLLSFNSFNGPIRLHAKNQ
jgi:hypothetical protein